MYYLSGKGQNNGVKGRGISLGDAFNEYGFSFSEIVSDTQDKHEYKTGVLHFKKISGEAVPFIQYEGDCEEHVCVAFQVRCSDDKYIDLNLRVLSRALSYISRSEK